MGVPGEGPNTQPLATGHALVDEVMAVVDALMRISSRTEDEFGSPAARSFGNALVRYCLADYWCEILRPEPEQVNGSGQVRVTGRNYRLHTYLRTVLCGLR